MTGALMKNLRRRGVYRRQIGATVVPVRIDWPRSARSAVWLGCSGDPLVPAINIRILTPTTLPMPEAPRARDRRALAGDRLMQIMMRARISTRTADALFHALLAAQHR